MTIFLQLSPIHGRTARVSDFISSLYHSKETDARDPDKMAYIGDDFLARAWSPPPLGEEFLRVRDTLPLGFAASHSLMSEMIAGQGISFNEFRKLISKCRICAKIMTRDLLEEHTCA